MRTVCNVRNEQSSDPYNFEFGRLLTILPDVLKFIFQSSFYSRILRRLFYWESPQPNGSGNGI